MKFNLTFSNTNDSVPFEIIQNEELFLWFLNQVDVKKVKPILNIAIANIPDLQNNLFFYRKMLYNNGKDGNTASLSIIK